MKTVLLILEKDIEKKRQNRQSKSVSEDLALNKVHQMMDSLLVSLHDQLKITNLGFYLDEEQRVQNGKIYLEAKKAATHEKVNCLQGVMGVFLCKAVQFCLEVKFSYYLSNSMADMIFTLLVVFNNSNILAHLQSQMTL